MRFIKENVKKNDFEPIDNIPFSAGSRNCIGQYIARIFIKSALASIFSTFEIENDPSLEPEFVIGAAYGIKDCKVRIRPWMFVS